MKTVFLFALVALLSGCADSGYHPSYIISHTDDKAPKEQAPEN